MLILAPVVIAVVPDLIAVAPSKYLAVVRQERQPAFGERVQMRLLALLKMFPTARRDRQG